MIFTSNRSRNPNKENSAMTKAITTVVTALMVVTLNVNVDMSAPSGISVDVGINTAHAQNWSALAGQFPRARMANKLFNIAAKCPGGVCPTAALANGGNSLRGKNGRAWAHCKTGYGLLDKKAGATCQEWVSKVPRFTHKDGDDECSSNADCPAGHVCRNGRCRRGGGGGKKKCPLAKDYFMPKDTADEQCVCPKPGVATNEVKRPGERRKTGCQELYSGKGCFVYSADPAEMQKECPCPKDKPFLNMEASPWVCEPCPADKPVWAELEDGTYGCVSCSDIDKAKPKYNECTGKCEACPEDKPYYNGSDCTQCQEPTPVYNVKTGKCEACPDGHQWQRPRLKGRCIKCLPYYVFSKEKNDCVTTKTHKCKGSGEMVADKKDCPKWSPTRDGGRGKWVKKLGKGDKCPAGSILAKTKDPSHPSVCVCAKCGPRDLKDMVLIKVTDCPKGFWGSVPWWLVLLIVLGLLCLGGFLLWLFFFLRKKKKEKEGEDNPPGARSSGGTFSDPGPTRPPAPGGGSAGV